MVQRFSTENLVESRIFRGVIRLPHFAVYPVCRGPNQEIAEAAGVLEMISRTPDRRMLLKSGGKSWRWKALPILLLLLLSVYAYSFFRYRKGLIGKDHPFTYVFSPDPIVHSRAMFIFRPMIFISGGQLESQWDLKSPEEKLKSRYAPMYPDAFTEHSIYALDHWSPPGSERPNKYWLR